MRRPLYAALLVLACTSVALAGGDKRSPFEMVRYVDGEPQVRVQKEWYTLVSLDGIPLKRVLEACKQLDPKRPQKRFCEDLPEALEGIGHKLGDTADLVVVKPQHSKTKTIKGVPVTEGNRDRIKDAEPWKAVARSRKVQRVERKHATKPDRRFAFLTIRHHEERSGVRLAAERVAQDLDQLEWLIENVFSYRDLKPFDYRAAFDTVRLAVADGVGIADFHIMLRKLVALFGDGHARVPGVKRVLPHGPLPFALADVGDRVAAVDERGRPIDRTHPYVQAIDGRSVEQWLDAAARLNARASPQFQRHMALDYGRRARFVRWELGLKHADEVEVTFADAKGSTRKRKLPLARRRVPQPHVRAPGALPEGIGYIRIADMGGRNRDVRQVIEGLAAFRKQLGRGLIIDVRGNGGGTRDILAALMPRLMPADADPVVVNVAAYRLPPGMGYDSQRGHLDNRQLHPPTSRRLGKEERTAAKALLAELETDWQPKAPEFTPLHVMIVRPVPQRVKPRFTGPIAVLIDEGCFSATDIFAGALEVLPHVTLIGRTTSGGSGRSQRYTLANSLLEVKLSSMASFRPTGARYDGKGVEPDIRVERTLAELAGEEDPTLERAIAHLRETIGR